MIDAISSHSEYTSRYPHAGRPHRVSIKYSRYFSKSCCARFRPQIIPNLHRSHSVSGSGSFRAFTSPTFLLDRLPSSSSSSSSVAVVVSCCCSCCSCCSASSLASEIGAGGTAAELRRLRCRGSSSSGTPTSAVLSSSMSRICNQSLNQSQNACAHTQKNCRLFLFLKNRPHQEREKKKTQRRR